MIQLADVIGSCSRSWPSARVSRCGLSWPGGAGGDRDTDADDHLPRTASQSRAVLAIADALGIDTVELFTDLGS
jgi:hypothetical protein